MRKLYVLFDEDCGFCRRVAIWLREQRAYLTLVVIARQSISARRRFGPVIDASGDDEMIAIADDGAVWRGTGAYLVVMWALRRTRKWSYRLSRPSLRPLVRGAFAALARNRRNLSRLMGYPSDDRIAHELRKHQPVTCAPIAAVKGGAR